MKRSDVDKLIDELIGEAVLSLLKENGPINTHALVQRLRSMKAHEKDPERRDAIGNVIAEINSGDGGFKHYRAVTERTELEGSQRVKSNNVVPLFSTGKPVDPKKIH